MKAIKEKVAILPSTQTLVWACIWAIIGMCVLYVYFMNETVFNVARRAHAEQEMAMVSSRISQLEFANISKRNEIDIDHAYALGYRDVQNLKYISKTSLTARAELNRVQ